MVKQTTYEGLMSRYMDGFGRTQPIRGEQVAATTATVLAGAGGTLSIQKTGFTKSPPTLPSGVTSYLVTRAFITSTGSGVLWLCKLVNLGNFNNTTNTFTDGSAMPTVTELGTSRVTSGAVIAEVTVALNSNAGNLVITYVDQDGNTAEAATSRAMTNSAAVGSMQFITINTSDVAVRDITNITRSGGASHAGTIVFYGVVPIAMLGNGGPTSGEGVDLLTTRFHYLPLGAADEIVVIQGISTTANTVCTGYLSMVGDS
jgi:hypothetical protein